MKTKKEINEKIIECDKVMKEAFNSGNRDLYNYYLSKLRVLEWMLEK